MNSFNKITWLNQKYKYINRILFESHFQITLEVLIYGLCECAVGPNGRTWVALNAHISATGLAMSNC